MFQGIFKSAINDANKNYIFGTGSIPIQIKSAQLATFADGTTKQQGYQVAEVNKLISTMLTGWDKDGNKPKSMSDNYLELILSCDNGFVVKKRLQFPHIIAWQNDSTQYNIANVYKEFSIDNWLKADDFQTPDITLVVEPTDEILTTSTATLPEATTEQSGRFYLYYRNLPVGVNRVHIEFHIKTQTEPIDFNLEVTDGLSWKDAQSILASNNKAKINVLLSSVKDLYNLVGKEGSFEEITMHEWSALYQQIISLKPNNKFTHDLYFYIYDESEITTKLTELEQKTKGINNEKIDDDSESIDILSESGEYVAHLDAEGFHSKDVFIQESKQGIRKNIVDELAKKIDKGDVPIVNEESQLLEEMIEFQTNEGNSVAGINKDGVYAIGFYVLNNGKKQPFYLSEEAQRLLTFETNYVSVKNGRLNGGSDNHGTKWYKRFSILHISDTHQFNKEYAEAVSIASGRVDIICNTGDDGNGNISQSESLSISDLAKGVDVVKNNNASNLPYLYVKGNHDVCNLKRMSYRNIVGNLIDSYSSDVVWGGTDVGYGYIDITPNSDIGTIRIIMLDQFDYPDADFPSIRDFMSCTYSQAQITWFINVIKDAASKSIKVITMSHYAFADTTNIWSEEIANADVNGQYQDAFIIADIIDAIQHGTIINKEYTDSKNKENIIVNEDFSSIANLHYICHLFGHIHSKNWYQCKKANGSKEYDILMIGETSVGRLGTALNKSCREGVNSTACSVLEIDTIEHCVYRVNYGAYMKYDATESKVIEKLNYRF